MPRSRETVGVLVNDNVRGEAHGKPTTAVGHSETRADNKFEALMRCQPGDEPEIDLQELGGLREILVDAIEALAPRELWIIEAVVYRRMSFRQCARELNLSTTHTFRIYRQTIEKLQAQLGDDPAIKEYLECRARNS